MHSSFKASFEVESIVRDKMKGICKDVPTRIYIYESKIYPASNMYIFVVL